MTRREFLQATALAALSATPLGAWARAATPKAQVRFGMVTDPHYADREPLGQRHYRESLAKLTEAVELMNDQQVDFLIELGDFKDEDKPAVEARTISYVRALESVFRRFKGPTYHVLGNHDMDSLSKAQFLSNITNTGITPRDRTYYSFDLNGVHLVVLDANYSANDDQAGYDHTHEVHQTFIPPAELAWLKSDLAGAAGPAIVFTHQLLDGSEWMHVRNSADVRQVLEQSGKVLACFQGHHHPGACQQLGGIHYYTLKGMVEGSGNQNSAYAVVAVHRDRQIVVTGYRHAVSQSLAPKS